MSKKEETKNVFIPYGIGHTKKYKKSVVCDYCVEVSDDVDKVTRITSDIELLLRQKAKCRAIGPEILRDYVQNLERDMPEQHNFTDDELFMLIEPKCINNLTTAFEYSRYLKDNGDKIKDKYSEMVAFHKRRNEQIKES